MTPDAQNQNPQPGTTGPAPQQQKGQADKRAAEERTQEVAEGNRPRTFSEAVDQGQDLQARIGTDNTPARTDDAPERAPVDAAADPFPNYSEADVDELASLAESRGVEMNRDVEKAQLIRALRDADAHPKRGEEARKAVEGTSNPYASYDVTPLEKLRELAKERGVELDEDFVKAHLITELRAADTGVTGTGVHVALVNQ